MAKPDRPPDALLNVAGWSDLTSEEQNQRIDEFLRELGVEPRERKEERAGLRDGEIPKDSA